MTDKNRLALLISGVLIALIAAIILILSFRQPKISHCIDAVPQEAAVILDTKNFIRFSEFLLKDTSLLVELKKSSLFRESVKNLILFDSLFQNNKKLKDAFSDNQLVISLQASGRNSSDFLYIIAANPEYTSQNFADIITSFETSKPKISLITYENTAIYHVKYSHAHHLNNSEFYFSICDGLLLSSASEFPINRAIRQLKNDISIVSDPDFKTIYTETTRQSKNNIIINFNNLSDIGTHIFDNSTNKSAQFCAKFSKWAGYSMSLDNGNNLNLEGIANVDNSYLHVFANEEPMTNDVIKFFPEKSSTFVILNFDKGSVFQKNYMHYLSEKHQLNSYKRQIELMYRDYSVKITDYRFIDAIGGNVALVYEDINKNGTEQNSYAFAHLADKSKMEAVLDTFIHAYSQKLKIPVDMLSIDFESHGKTITLHKWPASQIMENYFGEFFSDFHAGAYTLIDNWLVFGNSIPALRSFFETYQSGNTFENRSDCKSLFESISQKSNLTVYSDAAHSLSLWQKMLNTEIFDKINKNAQFLRKFRGPVFQFSGNSGKMNATAFINFSGKLESGNGTIWECRLDTLQNAVPFEVKNHITGEKEILIQDRRNMLYLIDKDGKIVWKRKLDGKILDNIHQVDYYKTGKLQYLFNTRETLYLFDRNAQNVGPYPVKLKTKASCGISVFDYDKNRNYRILLATINNKISLLNINADAIGGWKFSKTSKPVLNPLQYFSYKGKDYIIFADRQKIYILDRNGNVRVKPAADFPTGTHVKFFLEPDTETSKARFVTTNASGDVHFIYLNGTVKKMTLKNCFPEHYFSYIDINGDNKQEFIFLNKNEIVVFDRNNTEIFSYKFNNTISDAPMLWNISEKQVKIGVVSRSENKIYLFDANGKFTEKFPHEGNTPFIILQFDKNEDFSVITGNQKQYLYKYPLY